MPAAGDKYVVRTTGGHALAPGTYFVIRGSDLFAASGLWAYCHSLETALELDAQASFLSPVQAERLRNIADQATALAARWHREGLGRIPD